MFDTPGSQPPWDTLTDVQHGVAAILTAHFDQGVHNGADQ